MQEDEGHDLVHRQRLAALVDRADAVCVAVGRESDERAAFDDSLFERREVSVNRLRADAAEQRVALRAYGLRPQPPARQKTLDPAPARTMHRINDDARALRAYQFEVNVVRDLIAVALDLSRESAARVRRERGSPRRARVNKRLDGDGRLRRRAPAPRRFDLEAVKVRGIVRGGDDDSARRAALAHGPGDERRRNVRVEERDGDVVSGEDFSRAQREPFGEEAPVVADDGVRVRLLPGWAFAAV